MEEIKNVEKKKGNNVLKVVLIIVGVLVGFVAVCAIFDSTTGSKEEKTMVCTQKTEESGMTMDMTATISFVGNDAKKFDALMTVDLGEYKEYKDTFIETFKKEYKEYSDKGVNVDITSDDAKVIIKLNADKDHLKSTNFISKETFDDVKTELEKEGFSCKESE